MDTDSESGVGREAVGSGRFDIDKPAFRAWISALATRPQVRARQALYDVTRSRHCAYDPNKHRAYCFQRRGLAFFYQFWNNIRTRANAKKLFAAFPDSDLPYTPEVAARIQRAAITG